VLKSVDILIGIAVVMLVVSAAVTALTQFFLHIMQAKGKKLKEGISDLSMANYKNWRSPAVLIALIPSPECATSSSYSFI
jgi:hypothetical protein